MEDEFFSVPIADVRRELNRGLVECQKRGLLHTAKWLAEMIHGLKDGSVDNSIERNDFSASILEGIAPSEYEDYLLAKSYFDVREYDRAAYFLQNAESPVPKFLYMYSIYMSLEKRKLDSITNQQNMNDCQMTDLTELMGKLKSEYSRGKLDGYGLYLYGVVLKSLNLYQTALFVFMQSIRKAPTMWGSYLEMAPLIETKERLQAVNLESHWMKFFLQAHTYLEMYLNDEGLKAYEELQTAGFRKCIYVTAQMALAYHNKRDVQKAIEIFKAMQESDPYNLDYVDTYSNLLFVKEYKSAIVQLAQTAVKINKYRPETCCVIGNYYSIRCEHHLAILYFQRALKLNPKYLAAWTLMGHEFMELKNTNAAIQSYRKAVEINKRDYRAWYGLGQAYEILKMHNYSLYYFKISQQLRPYDSRMLVALGETYERLDRRDNAIKCYSKACDVGDIEGVAMYKMANLYERMGAYDLAVKHYTTYCANEREAIDKVSLYHGFITLANYYESKGEYDRASHFAYKCLESDERKSEAKSLLKTIENKRSGKLLPPAELPASMKLIKSNLSSGDEMDMDMSDMNFRPTGFFNGNRELGKAINKLIGFRSAASALNEEASTSRASSVTMHPSASSASNLTMNDFEVVDSSSASLNTPSVHILTPSSSSAVNNPGHDEDDDNAYMEVSISID